MNTKQSVIYHYTHPILATLIKKDGLEIHFPLKSDIITESKFEQIIDEFEELVLSHKEEYIHDFGDIYGEYEDRIENFLEDKYYSNVKENTFKGSFDELMDKYATDTKPIHSESIFLWKSGLPQRDKSVVYIDTNKIPCQCYEVDYNYSTNAFSRMLNLQDSNYLHDECVKYNIDELEKIIDNNDQLPYGWMMEDIENCVDAHKNAQKHYEAMKKYNPKTSSTNDGYEVICPCDIPSEAILKIQKPINIRKALKHFDFSLEKKPITHEITTLYRGSDNCDDLSVKVNGESSLGRGVYFSENRDFAETYNENVCEYELPKNIVLCEENDGDVGTIEGGDADDYFKNQLEDLNIHVESNSVEEKQMYNLLSAEIKNHYSTLGCDGLYTDWQIVIWNKEILEKMSKTSIEL